MATVAVHFNHVPMTFRVEEMVRGEVGMVAKQVGEFTLVNGRNEVDADAWARWLEMNKGGPFVTQGIVSEEKGTADAAREAAPADPSTDPVSDGSDRKEGEVRDGGVQVDPQAGDPTLPATGTD